MSITRVLMSFYLAYLGLAASVRSRVRQFIVDGDRGDENLTKVFWAVGVLTLAAVILVAVKAAVDTRLPQIK